jgi:hypothetical protein
MHTLLAAGLSIWHHLLDPALLAVDPADSGPTWTLAGACGFFLVMLGYSLRWGVKMAREATVLLYLEVLKPLAESQRRLLDTLSETRLADSRSLSAMNQAIQDLRADRETHEQKN